MRLPKKGSLLREVPVVIIAALIVSVVVKTFFIHFFFIPSGSMQNTLQIGDRIAVNKFANIYSDIRRGEVVVFKDPSNWLGTAQAPTGSRIVRDIKSGLVTVGVLPDPATQYLIKRVIGVGGDTVMCCDAKGKLVVDGVSSDSKFSVTVPKGFIWVMGDHRGDSADSRFHTDDVHHGMVPLGDVVGRAEWVVWPFSHAKFLPVGHDLSKVPVKK